VVEEAEEARLLEELARLPERARHVLVGRHGLGGGEPLTLREMAEEMGVSRERVRQLQREAERRLRSSAGTTARPAGTRRPDRPAEGEDPGLAWRSFGSAEAPGLRGAPEDLRLSPTARSELRSGGRRSWWIG
jgi:hypothetical protein